MQGWQRTVLWAVLFIPLLIQTYRYQIGTAFYGEYLHWTGDWAVWLLFLVLAITPLRRLLANAAWSSWLLRARRDLGVVTALYALAHTLVYLFRKADLDRILAEAAEAGMLVGWLAMVGMGLLALTSNDWSVRALGRRWKNLHRFSYLIALLSVGHWIMTAFDPTTGYIHLAVLTVLLASRFRPAGLNR